VSISNNHKGKLDKHAAQPRDVIPHKLSIEMYRKFLSGEPFEDQRTNLLEEARESRKRMI
jgi:hypothetical protein